MHVQGEAAWNGTPMKGDHGLKNPFIEIKYDGSNVPGIAPSVVVSKAVIGTLFRIRRYNLVELWHRPPLADLATISKPCPTFTDSCASLVTFPCVDEINYDQMRVLKPRARRRRIKKKAPMRPLKESKDIIGHNASVLSDQVVEKEAEVQSIQDENNRTSSHASEHYRSSSGTATEENLKIEERIIRPQPLPSQDYAAVDSDVTAVRSHSFTKLVQEEADEILPADYSHDIENDDTSDAADALSAKSLDRKSDQQAQPDLFQPVETTESRPQITSDTGRQHDDEIEAQSDTFNSAVRLKDVSNTNEVNAFTQEHSEAASSSEISSSVSEYELSGGHEEEAPGLRVTEQDRTSSQGHPLEIRQVLEAEYQADEAVTSSETEHVPSADEEEDMAKEEEDTLCAPKTADVMVRQDDGSEDDKRVTPAAEEEEEEDLASDDMSSDEAAEIEPESPMIGAKCPSIIITSVDSEVIESPSYQSNHVAEISSLPAGGSEDEISEDETLECRESIIRQDDEVEDNTPSQSEPNEAGDVLSMDSRDSESDLYEQQEEPLSTDHNDVTVVDSSTATGEVMPMNVVESIEIGTLEKPQNVQQELLESEQEEEEDVSNISEEDASNISEEGVSNISEEDASNISEEDASSILEEDVSNISEDEVPQKAEVIVHDASHLSSAEPSSEEGEDESEERAQIWGDAPLDELDRELLGKDAVSESHSSAQFSEDEEEPSSEDNETPEFASFIPASPAIEVSSPSRGESSSEAESRVSLPPLLTTTKSEHLMTGAEDDENQDDVSSETSSHDSVLVELGEPEEQRRYFHTEQESGRKVLAATTTSLTFPFDDRGIVTTSTVRREVVQQTKFPHDSASASSPSELSSSDSVSSEISSDDEEHDQTTAHDIHNQTVVADVCSNAEPETIDHQGPTINDRIMEAQEDSVSQSPIKGLVTSETEKTTTITTTKRLRLPQSDESGSEIESAEESSFSSSEEMIEITRAEIFDPVATGNTPRNDPNFRPVHGVEAGLAATVGADMNHRTDEMLTHMTDEEDFSDSSSMSAVQIVEEHQTTTTRQLIEQAAPNSTSPDYSKTWPSGSIVNNKDNRYQPDVVASPQADGQAPHDQSMMCPSSLPPSLKSSVSSDPSDPSEEDAFSDEEEEDDFPNPIPRVSVYGTSSAGRDPVEVEPLAECDLADGEDDGAIEQNPPPLSESSSVSNSASASSRPADKPDIHEAVAMELAKEDHQTAMPLNTSNLTASSDDQSVSEDTETIPYEQDNEKDEVPITAGRRTSSVSVSSMSVSSATSSSVSDVSEQLNKDISNEVLPVAAGDCRIDNEELFSARQSAPISASSSTAHAKDRRSNEINNLQWIEKTEGADTGEARLRHASASQNLLMSEDDPSMDSDFRPAPLNTRQVDEQKTSTVARTAPTSESKIAGEEDVDFGVTNGNFEVASSEDVSAEIGASEAASSVSSRLKHAKIMAEPELITNMTEKVFSTTTYPEHQDPTIATVTTYTLLEEPKVEKVSLVGAVDTFRSVRLKMVIGDDGRRRYHCPSCCEQMELASYRHIGAQLSPGKEGLVARGGQHDDNDGDMVTEETWLVKDYEDNSGDDNNDPLRLVATSAQPDGARLVEEVEETRLVENEEEVCQLVTIGTQTDVTTVPWTGEMGDEECSWSSSGDLDESCEGWELEVVRQSIPPTDVIITPETLSPSESHVNKHKTISHYHDHVHEPSVRREHRHKHQFDRQSFVFYS